MVILKDWIYRLSATGRRRAFQYTAAHNTTHVTQETQRMQEMVNDMAAICHVIKMRQIRGVFSPCIAFVSLAYGAVRERSSYVDVWYGDARRRMSTCINVRQRRVP